MKKAIKLAIEGGYDWKGRMFGLTTSAFDEMLHDDIPNGLIPFVDSILLDPEFWKCLGKEADEEIKAIRGFTDEELESWKKQPWLLAQHRFIDHLASGKDAESYFNDLLK